MAYTKNPFVDAMSTADQVAYYAAHPAEAVQEVERAKGVSGALADAWAKLIDSVIPKIELSEPAKYTPPVYTPPVVASVVSDPVTPYPTQVKASVAASVTTFPTGNVPVPTQQSISERDLRQKAMNDNIWSNDTTIAVLEKKAWAIYVDTGRWDTPEQLQYHAAAESIRPSINPLIQPSRDGSGEVGKILPTDQFPTTNGMDTKGMIALGAGGLFLVIIMSMFRR